MPMRVRPDEVLVLGSPTCEDTAIVRSRLDALAIPYRYGDVDDDPEAAAQTMRLNDGARVTPTVVIGDGLAVAAEPSLERLTELLRAGGHEVSPPAATQYHGALADAPVPTRHLPTAAGAELSIASLVGRSQSALFLAHGVDCLACLGYARQLVGQRAALDDADAVPIVAVEVPEGAGPETAAEWVHALGADARVLLDAGGAWKRAVAGHVGLSADDAIVLALDRYAAARAGSAAAEAGGLIDPGEAVAWLRFIALECPECAGELAWEQS